MIHETYEEELKDTNTLLLIKILTNIYGYQKVDSNKIICELGCKKGQKLFAISESFPNFNYVGYDINKRFVRKGNIYIDKMQLKTSSIHLYVHDLELLDIEYDSDVTFTSLTLMYISPKKIEQVIRLIVNNSRDGFIFQELISSIENTELLGYSHNYRNIFLRLGLYEEYDIEFSGINTVELVNKPYNLHCIVAKRKNIYV